MRSEIANEFWQYAASLTGCGGCSCFRLTAHSLIPIVIGIVSFASSQKKGGEKQLRLVVKNTEVND